VRAVVAGGGVFGLTAAIALRRRGVEVLLVDPGPIPHPLAESTDVSKVVRIDYGADEEYTALAERALEGWRRWSLAAERPFLHETGVLFASAEPMGPGGFEQESFTLLARRGHPVERLDAAAIARRFHAFRPGALIDGYHNRVGGWVEASAVVRHLLGEATRLGAEVRGGLAARAIRGRGLELADGSTVAGDLVVIAAGAWTALLCPWLAGALRPVGQTVFHLQPIDPDPFERLPVFGADIARTGMYGFPLAGGVVKIGNHGPGVPVDMARDRRAVPETMERELRRFLADTLPGLAGAPITSRRLCVYCDTADEHFWIAADPDRPGVIVASGGSGHAFKFAPVLGDLIADAALGAPLPARFRWRPEQVAGGQEAARFRGPTR
jgi:glycine/D-amino acid oxidase-like deaminating enzyme